MSDDGWLVRLGVWWVGRPYTDWIVTAILAGLHATTVAVTGGGDLLAWAEREQRVTVYTTTATVAALVGSFVTAAIAQYAASTGRRMRVLRSSRHLGRQIRRNWVSILSGTLTVSGLCLLATVLDTTERDPGGAHWLAEAGILLGAVRAARLVWLFNKIISAGDDDFADMPRLPGPSPDATLSPPPAPLQPPGT